MKNNYPTYCRCPREGCRGKAYVGKEDGSTMLTCFECGYKAPIKLANLLYKQSTQKEYAQLLPSMEQ